MIDITKTNIGDIIYAGFDNATPCKVVNVKSKDEIVGMLRKINEDGEYVWNQINLLLNVDECFNEPQK